MFYINTETNDYPIEEGFIRSEFPNTSFPTPFVAPYPYAVVNDTPEPFYDPTYQYLQRIQPNLVDGEYFTVWEVLDYTSEQITYNEGRVKASNKEQAERLLQETDWVEVPSVSDTNRIPHLTNYEEFMTYRMALRAIAVTPPVIVAEWPVLPQENWVTE